jgi:hypothetical protein
LSTSRPGAKRIVSVGSVDRDAPGTRYTVDDLGGGTTIGRVSMTAYQRLNAIGRHPVGPAGDRAGGPPDERPTAAYDLAWIDRDGRAMWDRRRLPDTPQVDAAVSMLGRGALLRGPRGPVAVEDLLPGDRVETVAGGTTQIDWIGTRTYGATGPRPVLYRVAARAFGGDGPDSDAVLGCAAHLLVDSPRCRPLVGAERAFAPVAAFEDGAAVTRIAPQGEVTVYGLACAGQEALAVQGMALETYHPARTVARTLTRTALADMALLFPQAVDGFGAPRIPYLSPTEARTLLQG